ncbi:electron transport complex protein rnfE [Vibrio ishigakensis]|uniref:Electron transport complex protein rnfE n=1 Tax=Vibrio ishigakensis TaxID=1481914 RepID=A0A0B8NSK4_9VIBR|nr:electron transport complex protein rnfE [Vibrio ishigakensis]
MTDVTSEQATPNNDELKAEHKQLLKNGLWNNNPALVQLLGLCPLLAVSATVTNALGLGIATLVVLVTTNLTVSLLRNHVPQEIRLPIFVMIIAASVTCVQLLMNAYAYGLYLSLGIFIPLIVTNCVIIGRAELTPLVIHLCWPLPTDSGWVWV